MNCFVCEKDIDSLKESYICLGMVCPRRLLKENISTPSLLFHNNCFEEIAGKEYINILESKYQNSEPSLWKGYMKEFLDLCSTITSTGKKMNYCHYCEKDIGTSLHHDYIAISLREPKMYATIYFHINCFTEAAGEEYIHTLRTKKIDKKVHFPSFEPLKLPVPSFEPLKLPEKTKCNTCQKMVTPAWSLNGKCIFCYVL